MRRGRIRSLVLAPLAAAALVLVAPAVGAQAAPSTACPGTFQVLHEDSIGSLRLRAGAYQIAVADPQRLSCARAAQDLAEFLRDYDGRLRRPWTVNAPLATFQRGIDPTVRFWLARAANPGRGGGGGPAPNPTAGACQGFFDVLHNDHIGSLAVRKGAYRITLLGAHALSCRAAARLFSSFLRDFDGRLPKPWMLSNATATFTRRGTAVGFRIKPAVGRDAKPSAGGRLPAKGQPSECPGTFRVLTRTRVAGVSMPAGPYLTFTYRGSGVNCGQASRLFRTFLSGTNVPRGYFLTRGTGVFTKGKRRPVFRVKPASPRGSTAR